ncbi:MAG: hypothetical protein NVSMB46_03240 [Candidatus Saccharimonadales bacterium]
MNEGINRVIGSSSIDSLRSILEHELSRSIDYEEVAEVAESLLDFYELLAMGAEAHD